MSGAAATTAAGRAGAARFVFHLPAEGAGHGDVVMVPFPRMIPQSPGRTGLEGDVGLSTAATVIHILEVRIANGMISGELEPYFAPGEGLVVGTSFRGMVDGETITSTFTVHSGSHAAPFSGTSSVRRRSSQTDLRAQE